MNPRAILLVIQNNYRLWQILILNSPVTFDSNIYSIEYL